MESPEKPTIEFRQPQINDGKAIYELIKQSPPLDVNSSYLYFLQATHFADTCIVAEVQDKIVGFVSAYFRPDSKNSLFVWQVAVSDQIRGQGVGKQLIHHLLKSQKNRTNIEELCCTISPSNKASQNLFKSFAEQYRLSLHVETFIEESHFGDLGHEAEELYTLRAPYNQNIINTLI